MAENIVVYSKVSGGVPIPLTVRIMWLQNGLIVPLLYWTPDGTCYRVIESSPGIPMAFLKEGGVGLRYYIRGEIIETPDPEAEDLLHRTEETYIYLADKKFSERNIIDVEQYGHPGKEYIPVTLDVFEDGSYELIYFTVHGERYMVEKTADVGNRGSYKAGGVGIWHKVNARLINKGDDEDPDPQKSVRRSAAIYLELNKWFVCVAATA
jgi:hypothetical protein